MFTVTDARFCAFDKNFQHYTLILVYKQRTEDYNG